VWEEEQFIKCMACSFIKYVGISAECLGCVHAVGAPLLWGCSFSLFDIDLCSSKKKKKQTEKILWESIGLRGIILVPSYP
jgi:hypothetical protein